MNEDEEKVMARLHQFSNGYDSKDLDSVLSTFNRNFDTTVVVGSGCDEPIIGIQAISQQLTREFTRLNNLRLRATWMKLNIVGNVAWVTALSEITGTVAQSPLTGRFTAILVKETEGWFIAHLHFSFPLELAKQPFELLSSRD